MVVECFLPSRYLAVEARRDAGALIIYFNTHLAVIL